MFRCWWYATGWWCDTNLFVVVVYECYVGSPMIAIAADVVVVGLLNESVDLSPLNSEVSCLELFFSG